MRGVTPLLQHDFMAFPRTTSHIFYFLGNVHLGDQEQDIILW